MAYGCGLFVEPVREAAFGSITSSYTAVGTLTVTYARIFEFVNTTNTDLYISLDGVNNHFRVPANGFVLVDVTANEVSPDQGYFLPLRTIFYVKQTSAGAPSSGELWIHVIGANVKV